MAQSTTETIGFCNQVIQLIQDHSDELKTKGLDVTSWIPELTSVKNETVTDDAEKDAIQTLAKTTTKKANASRERCYKMTSSKLDAVIGVLGKDTDSAKQAARLRSSLTGKVRKKKDKKPPA
jgi:hypothetical protein